MITGAAAMIKCLEAEGIETIFGYPGAAIAPFYDAVAQSKIRHVLTRTEQGAGHAASGFARMTGRPGVCVATSGPGATNLFTAIATAYSDSIPLVAITGQVATHLLGRDVFQEVDTTGAAEPFTKYSYLVKSADELPRVLREAFYIASTGRQGPVLIDVPVDVQRQSLKFSYPKSVSIRGYKPKTEGHALQVKRVAEAISKAKRPLLCCGGGVFLSRAQAEVRQLCEEASIPLVSTMMGIGALPAGHPLYFGMLGQSGSKCANKAVDDADLLILIGARVGDRAITQPSAFGDRATVAHIDIDTAEIGKNVGTTIPLVGDAKNALGQIIKKEPRGAFEAWRNSLEVLRNTEEKTVRSSGGVNPDALVHALCRALPEDSVYVSDVGQNQIWSARGFSRYGRGRFLTTGGMGTMGYAIPAAIGAKLSSPQKTVLAVCGDGAFQISMNELAAMNQHGAPVKLVVCNNGRLGMIREIQSNAFGRECAVTLSGGPDIAQIAAAYGIAYLRVDQTEECEPAVARLLEHDEPFLLECMVDPEEVVG